MNISCPNCEASPNVEFVWECEACHYEWAIFTTHGFCPRCKHANEQTQCLSCGEIHPHINWYNDIDDKLKSLNIVRD